MNALPYFEKLSIQLNLQHNFWGWVLQQTNRQLNPQIETVGISLQSNGHPVFLVSPKLPKWDNDLLLHTIKHECLHLVFNHIRQRLSFQNKDFFDLAADWVVNQLLEESTTSPLPAFFEQLDAEPFQTVAYYYRAISTYYKATKENKNTLDQFIANNKHHWIKHNLWNNNSEENWPMQLGIKLNQAFHNPKIKIPETIELAIEKWGEIAGPLLSWKKQLSLFMASGGKTYLYSSRRKISKRYGVAPGNKIRRNYNILLAIDTSGSVSESLLRLFFREIQQIYQQGVKIDLLECDTQIRKKYPFNGEPIAMISGRGGTDYNPVIRYYNQFPAYGGLIYFTDGLGYTPVEVPDRPMLWVIFNTGIRKEWSEWPGQLTYISNSL